MYLTRKDIVRTKCTTWLSPSCRHGGKFRCICLLIVLRLYFTDSAHQHVRSRHERL